MEPNLEMLDTRADHFKTLLKKEEAEHGGKKLTMLVDKENGGFVAVPEDAKEAMDVDEPMSQGLPGQMQQRRTNEVRNNAGGFVFAVSEETRIRRFLILGSSSGTFYVSEQALTLDNVEALISIINAGNGAKLLREIYAISTAGRNPKQDPLLLAFALAARYRPNDVTRIFYNRDLCNAYIKYLEALHAAALAMLNDICRIPTHLFSFVKYCELVASQTAAGSAGKSTGWGRGLRNAIVNWYNSKTPQQLAMAVTKYAQRNGWSHRDLFRLAHPCLNKCNDAEDFLERSQVYYYIVNRALKTRKRKLPELEVVLENPATNYTEAQLTRENESKALDFLEEYIQWSKDLTVERALNGIKAHGFVREHVPTHLLNEKAIWEALLENMPYIALTRNLAKMQAIDLISGDNVAKVCAKLTDLEAIRKSRVHPVQILTAFHIYRLGRGEKGSLHWTPNKEVISALEAAFYASFKNVEPTGKRFCFAFDVSGSMCSNVLGGPLTCRMGSIAMGMVDVVAFTEKITEIPFDKTWTLSQTNDYFNKLSFSATDCALPMLWAKENNRKVDCFVVFTDCETWYGEVHPYEALQKYRESSGIHDAKLIVCGMASTNFTIACPSDLDICGFDAAVPELVANFAKGLI